MKMKVIEKFRIAKIHKGKENAFVLLGDTGYNGTTSVFVKNEQVEGLEVHDLVEVEMIIKVGNLQKKDENGNSMFVEYIAHKNVLSIKKV